MGDLDLLVLGDPDRDALYVAAAHAGKRLGREVQVTVRNAGWLKTGSGSFHATVQGRPTVRIDVPEESPAD